MSDRGGDKKYIDKKRSEYYSHSNLNCELDIEKSAFMEPTEGRLSITAVFTIM